MPRYYFDLTNGDGLTRDDHGQELSQRENVRAEAIRILRDVTNDELPDGDRDTFTVTVREVGGHTIFEASLSFRADWLE